MILTALVRFIGRTGYSAAMAFLGVCLAASSIVAVHVVTAEVSGQMDELIPAPLKRFSHVAVHDDGAINAERYFGLRRAWRDGVLPEADAIAPVIDEQIELAGRQIRVVGVDLLASDQLAEISDGALERTSTEAMTGVWLSSDLGDDDRLHAALGSPTVLGSLDGSAVVLADIGTAQEVLGWSQDDRLSYVALSVPSAGATLKDWAERFSPGASAAWPDPPLKGVEGWTLRSALDQHPTARFGRSVLFNVSALGMLALVVAWFLIYQVAVFWLRRMSAMFSRLHILGVSMERLAAYFVGLLVTLGTFAALVGAWLGLALARVLMDAIAGGQPEGGLSMLLLGKALGSASFVCAAGGGWAFLTEYREGKAPGRADGRSILRGAVVGFGACLIALGVMVESTHLAGAFMSIAILSVLLAILMPLVMSAVKRRSRFAAGSMMLRMSLRESVWFPRDLSVAVSGLCLATATAIGIGLMVDSFRADFSRMLEQRLSYDYDMTGSVDALDAARQVLQRSPEVERLQAYFESQTRVSGVAVTLTETRLDAVESKRYGMTRALGDQEALVGEQLARRLDLATGDSLSTGDGRQYRVAGVFQGFGDVRPRLIVPLASSSMGTLTEVRFDIAADATIDALHGALVGVERRDQREIRRLALETFDRTFLITSVLVSIAIFVAGIGVYVAVTVLRLNQRVSDRVLQGLGVSVAETRLIDLARGAGFGLLACGLAVPLGIGIGWILCAVVNPRAFGWEIDFAVSAWPIFNPLLWGMAAALGASLLRFGSGEDARGVPLE